ncbi:MAG: cell division protein FtsK [Bacteroidetes bacterium HGW-Bacteroidetes-4]|jgi:S-DNA-T family DNA segregation ATPase FtsK/SpoIIIE|nr:MAG: cell division protein FtsK [Bacteroidetes bacterium HGW-Bacteroidetes-4]
MADKKKTPGKGGERKTVKGKSLANDERVKIIVGVFLISLAVYLLFAFVSYFFTWQIDQSKLDLSLIELFKNAELVVENWSGKLGALFAHKFMHDWFGVASLSFVFLMALLGIRLLGYRLLPLKRTTKYVLVATLWLSVSLGFIFRSSDFVPGGAHGYFLSNWFISLIGNIGTGFLLAIVLFAYLAFLFEGFIGGVRALIKSVFEARVIDTRLNPDDEVLINIPEEKEPEPATAILPQNDEVENEVQIQPVEEDSDDDDSFIVDYTTRQEESLTPDEGINKAEPSDDNDPFDNLETIEIKVVENAQETQEQSVKHEKETPTDDEIELSIENRTSDDDAPVKHIGDKPQGDYDPTMDLSHYKLPPIELLVEHNAGNVSVSEDELHSNKNRIVETLANYKIQIDKIKAIVGPTITLYEIVPAPGVRISKIKNLEDDIALSLAALGIRIIAPIPGRGTVGIEVPNLKPEVVAMRTIISSKRFQESKFELPIALGKTISNETFVVDLTKMPHLLVAGATGQGKSVGLNAILTSLLYKKHPAQLKLVLVDPKKVELTLYQKLENHFLAKLPDSEESIITDTLKVVNTLNSLCIEMDNRYDLLKEAQVRNIKEYNAKFIGRKLNPQKGHHFLPYIVVVIDEFADLIMTAGKEVELPIARLAQLARAIGIHLIIATQRPTTNIITGLIKANFPARIAFRVTSMMDSRTILDSPGANQLIGRGDMLISQGSEMVRLQCAFIDTPELESIVNYIQGQQSYPGPYPLPEYVGEDSGSDLGDVDLSKRDALFDDAARIIVANQQGSTSLIQRKFSIGYNRAGRIIDQLEAAGVVGSFEGSKARQVLIPDEYSLEQLLNGLNK